MTTQTKIRTSYIQRQITQAAFVRGADKDARGTPWNVEQIMARQLLSRISSMCNQVARLRANQRLHALQSHAALLGYVARDLLSDAGACRDLSIGGNVDDYMVFGYAQAASLFTESECAGCDLESHALESAKMEVKR